MSAQTDSFTALAGRAETPGAPPGRLPHPPRRWRTRVLVPGLLLGGMLLVLVYTGWRSLQGAVEVRVAPVVLKAAEAPGTGDPSAPVEVTGDSPIVQAAGWIEPDPFPTYVPALAEGVIEEVLVLEGDRVEAGQVVARLVDDEARLGLARAEAEVGIARAEVEEARAELEAAQAAWDNPIARTRAVAVAEAEVAASSAEIILVEAEVALERARLDEARDEVERMSRSSELLAAAAGEFARARLRAATQERAVEASGARMAVMEAHLRHHEAELQAARESQRLRIEERRALAGAKAQVARAEAHVLQDEASRDDASLRLLRMEVRSPVGGVVMSRLVEPGSRIMLISDELHASHVLRLYDPAKLQVRVDIPLSEAAKVGVGQRAEIGTDALPDEVFRGIVTRRVDEANIQKNTVQVKVAIEGPSPVLRPEMLARARFFGAPTGGPGRPGPSAAAPGRLLLAREALRDAADGRAKAWVVDQARETVVLRDVRFRPAGSEGWVEVLEGLKPGDRVVVGDVGHLHQGTRVRIAGEADALANAAGAAAPPGGHR